MVKGPKTFPWVVDELLNIANLIRGFILEGLADLQQEARLPIVKADNWFIQVTQLFPGSCVLCKLDFTDNDELGTNKECVWLTPAHAMHITKAKPRPSQYFKGQITPLQVFNDSPLIGLPLGSGPFEVLLLDRLPQGWLPRQATPAQSLDGTGAPPWHFPCVR